jgi:hypothetical protein
LADAQIAVYVINEPVSFMFYLVIIATSQVGRMTHFHYCYMAVAQCWERTGMMKSLRLWNAISIIIVIIIDKGIAQNSM